MKNLTKVIGIGLAVIGFVCIRLYQKELFYDPLILFYKSNFQNATFPQLDFWRYNINLLFRYLLNTILSVLIIWFWFEKKTYVVFSGFLYTLILLLGIIAFWIVEQDILPKNYMKLFYIRRFLIQPILVIILIPAFYFQKISKKG